MKYLLIIHSMMLIFQCIKNKQELRAGEIAKCLRGHAVHVGDPRMVPTTYIEYLTNACNSRSRG